MYTQTVAKKKRQKTPKGHEIPVPKREEFPRDLKKADSTTPCATS